MVKARTRKVFTGFRLGVISLALIAFGITGNAPVGSAQTGSGSPPPTYDYDDSMPGVQAPTVPQIAGAEFRNLRPFRLLIPVRVPLAEVQALLPPGFTAVANPAGSETGQVQLHFFFHSRTTRIADGLTVGGSALQLNTQVLNTNIVPNRQETGVLISFVSTQEWADLINLTAPGAARLANITGQVSEENNRLGIKYSVSDESIGFNVSAEATATGPIVNRNTGGLTTFRDLTANQSYVGSGAVDGLAVPSGMANVSVQAPDGKLQIPVAGGGSRSVTLVGYGPNVNFNRNLEFFTKFE
ncbi:MAG: hypothetical protein HY650_06790 [Acidobacteria bacterium]|nr:hypothetical protein [Acidobacteriota bacterium]